MPKAFKSLQQSMVSVDDPDHHRLRNLVHQAFTPRRVEQLAGDINRIVDGLLDQLEQKTQVDLLAEYALPLPLTVISDMLGVPLEDRHKFHPWSSKFLEVGAGDPTVFLRQIPNALRMTRFFEKLIALRKANPGNDLVTALITAEDAGDRLSQDELIAMIFLLLLAGHETTVNLIGTGVLALLQHPAQLQQLRENPDLIDDAVEELLRYGNPVEHGTTRHALEDVQIGGQVIPKGSTVLLLLSSANRDEQIFENPEQLDITRSPNRHLGFGIHYCLGAASTAGGTHRDPEAVSTVSQPPPGGSSGAAGVEKHDGGAWFTVSPGRRQIALRKAARPECVEGQASHYNRGADSCLEQGRHRRFPAIQGRVRS